MVSIAPKIGCTLETLRTSVRQSETNQGIRGGMSSSDRNRLKQLERDNRELKRANEILRKAREQDLDRLPDRLKRNKLLECNIQRVWEQLQSLRDANKVSRQLLREYLCCPLYSRTANEET